MTKTAKLAIVRALQDRPGVTPEDISEELEIGVTEVRNFIATLEPKLGREIQKLYGFRR